MKVKIFYLLFVVLLFANANARPPIPPDINAEH